MGYEAKPNIKLDLLSLSARLLDVGANLTVDCSNLIGFAQITQVFYQNIWNIPQPKITILNINIGTKTYKGLPFHQEAYWLVSNDQQINFTGFLES